MAWYLYLLFLGAVLASWISAWARTLSTNAYRKNGRKMAENWWSN